MLFFFNDTATTEIYTLSLHDALPISTARVVEQRKLQIVESVRDCPTVSQSALVSEAGCLAERRGCTEQNHEHDDEQCRDRKSTRLNSSHSQISYAVFCLKKNTTAISC